MRGSARIPRNSWEKGWKKPAGKSLVLFFWVIILPSPDPTTNFFFYFLFWPNPNGEESGFQMETSEWKIDCIFKRLEQGSLGAESADWDERQNNTRADAWEILRHEVVEVHTNIHTYIHDTLWTLEGSQTVTWTWARCESFTFPSPFKGRAGVFF